MNAMLDALESNLLRRQVARLRHRALRRRAVHLAAGLHDGRSLRRVRSRGGRRLSTSRAIRVGGCRSSPSTAPPTRSCTSTGAWALPCSTTPSVGRPHPRPPLPPANLNGKGYPANVKAWAAKDGCNLQPDRQTRERARRSCAPTGARRARPSSSTSSSAAATPGRGARSARRWRRSPGRRPSRSTPPTSSGSSSGSTASAAEPASDRRQRPSHRGGRRSAAAPHALGRVRRGDHDAAHGLAEADGVERREVARPATPPPSWPAAPAERRPPDDRPAPGPRRAGRRAATTRHTRPICARPLGVDGLAGEQQLHGVGPRRCAAATGWPPRWRGCRGGPRDSRSVARSLARTKSHHVTRVSP